MISETEWHPVDLPESEAHETKQEVFGLVPDPNDGKLIWVKRSPDKTYRVFKKVEGK